MLKEKTTFIKKHEDYHVRQSIIPDSTVKLLDICLNESENGVVDEMKEFVVNAGDENSDENRVFFQNRNTNIFSSFSNIETAPIIYRKHLLANLKSA